jgi:predicted transcriptional regulator
MKTIERLLEAKGYDIWSITPDASVYEAVRLMADQEIGALLVLESGNPNPDFREMHKTQG